MTFNRRALLLSAAILAGFLGITANSAVAQTFPSRPITLLVPFPPGGSTDLIARAVAPKLQETFGQPFVVENKAGAQGAIAAAEVAKATPDGYTLMLTTNTPQAANVSLFKKLNYDPVKDFTPITRYGTTSFMLMVRPDFPAKDLKGFIAHARSQPGKLSGGYGSAGSQVSLAMLKQLGKPDRETGDIYRHRWHYNGLARDGGRVVFEFEDILVSNVEVHWDKDQK